MAQRGKMTAPRGTVDVYGEPIHFSLLFFLRSF